MTKSMAQLADEILSAHGVSDEEGNINSFPAQPLEESHGQSPSLPLSPSPQGVPVHEALPPMSDAARDMFIGNALLAEGKIKNLSVRAEEGDMLAQKRLDNLNNPEYDTRRPVKKGKRKTKLTKEEIEVLKAARHILQEMTGTGSIGVNMGGGGFVPNPNYSYPGIEKPKKKKKKISSKKKRVAENHVVQGDPMFSKAWNSGIITKIPDKKTMYFTGKPQKLKRRKR